MTADERCALLILHGVTVWGGLGITRPSSAAHVFVRQDKAHGHAKDGIPATLRWFEARNVWDIAHILPSPSRSEGVITPELVATLPDELLMRWLYPPKLD